MRFSFVASVSVFALSLSLVHPVPAAAEETAQTIMAAAEARAKQESKNVLVTFSASWCVNCRLFDRMLEDAKIGPILSGAFVHVDLITGERPDDKRHANTPGGLEYEGKLAGGHAGWPYLAMLDSQGKLLADSFRPEKGKPHAENIGYPATREEIDWFMQMLRTAAPNLTDADRETVQKWLKKHSPV